MTGYICFQAGFISYGRVDYNHNHIEIIVRNPMPIKEKYAEHAVQRGKIMKESILLTKAMDDFLSNDFKKPKAYNQFVKACVHLSNVTAFKVSRADITRLFNALKGDYHQHPEIKVLTMIMKKYVNATKMMKRDEHKATSQILTMLVDMRDQKNQKINSMKKQMSELLRALSEKDLENSSFKRRIKELTNGVGNENSKVRVLAQQMDIKAETKISKQLLEIKRLKEMNAEMNFANEQLLCENEQLKGGKGSKWMYSGASSDLKEQVVELERQAENREVEKDQLIYENVALRDHLEMLKEEVRALRNTGHSVKGNLYRKPLLPDWN